MTAYDRLELPRPSVELTTTRRRVPRFDAAPAFPAATLFSVIAIDSTHVRATFATPVLDNDALRCTASYHFTATPPALPLEVFEVVPEGALGPSGADSVLITTSEMLQGGDYHLLIDVLEAVTGE